MEILRSNYNVPILIEFWREAPDFRAEVPVRIRIGDIDLFESHGPDGSLLPNLPLLLPRFASLGMSCLRLAKNTGRAGLELDEYANELLFQVTSDQVSVHNTMSERTATVGYDHLFGAWLAFAEDLRGVVSQRNSDKTSSSWWSLIYEDPPSQIAHILTEPSLFEE